MKLVMRSVSIHLIEVVLPSSLGLALLSGKVGTDRSKGCL
jgi:hypothetical protein